MAASRNATPRSTAAAPLALALLLAAGAGDARELWCDRLSTAPAPVVLQIDTLAGKVIHDAPAAVPALKTEGLLPGQGLYDASQRAKLDFAKLRALAYGWRTQRQRPMLDSARGFVSAWARTYQPNLNPIDETDLKQVFEAYALIRDNLEAAERDAADAWIRRFYDGYLGGMTRRRVAGNPDRKNWQSHRLKIATAAAAALGDATLLAPLRPLFEEHVAANIRDDGSTEDFHERDALSYTTYSLLPLVEAALIARTAGVDWVAPGTPTRARLVAALDWLEPYAMGRKQHIEFVRSSVKFDQVRMQAGMAGHQQAPWQPVNARELYWHAAYLEPRFLAVAQALAARPSAFLAACRGTAGPR
jgi:hypothetical protein